MSAHEAPSLEWVASHYALLQELEPFLLVMRFPPRPRSSNDAWFGKAGGVVKGERKALHERISQGFLAEHSPVHEGQTLVAIVLAGPPGSGKSTSLRTLFEQGDTHITSPFET